MNDKYSKKEKRALKKLGISDFRHITKDKLMQFVSMTSKMDPEVAKAAIAQFPNFSELVKDSLLDYKEILLETFSQDSEGDERVFYFYDSVKTAIENVLYEGELSFKQKQWCIEQLKDLAKMVAEQEKANKHHRRAILLGFATALGAAVGAAAALLGGSSQTSESDDDPI